MKVLLDTSVLLWWLSAPEKIPADLLEALSDPDAVVLFSQVSLLEIQIKVGFDKLALDFPVEQIPELAERSGLTALALDNAAIFTLPKLPLIHRDPFDRLLVCEAIQQGVPLVSSDGVLHRYPVKIEWN